MKNWKKILGLILVGVFLVALPIGATTNKDDMIYKGTARFDDEVEFRNSIIGLPGNTGNVWYVDSVAGADTIVDNWGKSWRRPFATLDYAVDQSTTTQGDVVLVLSGSSYFITAAGTLTLDKAGVRIIGVGVGRNRPWINLTAAASDIEVDSANCSIENFYIDMSGVSLGVNAGIDVDAADFTLKDCEIIMSEVSGYNAQTAIIMDSAADRTKIIDNIFNSAVTTGLTISKSESGVTTTGTTAPDSVTITGNTFRGYWSAAPIYVATGTAAAAKPWTVDNNKFSITNDGYEAVVLGGSLIPFYPASGGPYISTKTYTSGITNLFSVNGPIRLKSMIGVVTITTGSAIGNTFVTVDPLTPATDTPLCSLLDISSDAKGTVYTFSGVSGEPLIATTLGVVIPETSGGIGNLTGQTRWVLPPEGIIIPSGTIEQSTAGSSTGEIKWFIVWDPLKPGAFVRPD